jgi:hypothetical protein
MITTVTGALAAVAAIEALRGGTWSVSALQDYFGTTESQVPCSEHAPA